MVIPGIWAGRPIIISAKSNCLTLSIELPGDTRVFSYDLSGRLWTAKLDGISYRRGLDGKIVAKWQTSSHDRERRWLSTAEAVQIVDAARRTAAKFLADLASRQITTHMPLGAPFLQVFQAAANFDQARTAREKDQYRETYQPVGILPPDQYMAVVLQATQGCSFNTCTFCNFYRDRPFKIKTTAEFRDHIRAVRTFLGAGWSLRRTIFLGDANALVIPMPRLRALLEVVNQELDVEALDGIYAFLDGFSGEKKTGQDYADLARLGLKRIYIGLESGSADLLAFLKKPGHPEDVVSAVQSIKEGGLSVGVIVLLGAGGVQYSQTHITETVAVLNRMKLDADDLIYFSELIESEGLEYTRAAYSAHLSPLSQAERIAQGDEIERQLVFHPEAGMPPISRYDIREFVY